MKRLILVSTVVLMLNTAFLAQQRNNHRIDNALAACLKNARATMPRAECYSKAFDAWKSDVTKTYAALRLALPIDARPVFERSQRNWEKYRDSEFELIANLYAARKGTGYIATRIILRTDRVKNRALVLEERLEAYK
jgi:uncharacterized protein YecT (DUF1311 family)